MNPFLVRNHFQEHLEQRLSEGRVVCVFGVRSALRLASAPPLCLKEGEDGGETSVPAECLNWVLGSRVRMPRRPCSEAEQRWQLLAAKCAYGWHQDRQLEIFRTGRPVGNGPLRLFAEYRRITEKLYEELTFLRVALGYFDSPPRDRYRRKRKDDAGSPGSDGSRPSPRSG